MGMLERYKEYCGVLEGKQLMEQYMNAFELKSDKYINYKGEKDNFWIYNTTRLMMDRDSYRTHLYDTEEYIKGSYSYSLYLHKLKDLVILVAPMICTAYSKQYDYNISRYFKYRLAKMGFKTVEVHPTKSVFGAYSAYAVFRLKILIQPEIPAEELQKLILFIEKLNSYILDNSLIVWDSTKDVLEQVDPIFMEYVKKTQECS